jgi:hypothetical protein
MAQQAARAAGVALALRRVREATRRVFVIAGLVTFLDVKWGESPTSSCVRRHPNDPRKSTLTAPSREDASVMTN